MTNFRRWFMAAAAMALLSGLANAQIGTATGPANSPLSCTATSGGTPVLRPEGYTELLGDIVITCTGGPALFTGEQIPRVNITVYVSNAPITSRNIDTSGNPSYWLSEALLLIDEPGSALPTGATGNYGSQAPQSLCTSTDLFGCPAYAELDGTGTYAVATTAPTSGSPNAANVYQGYVGWAGPSTVTFLSVPVLPPVLQGVSRVFRITNIRIPAVGLTGTVQAEISVSPSTVLPIAGGAIPVGVVGPQTVAAVNPGPSGGGSPFSQCVAPTGPTLTAQVSFIEGFATAFKTRAVALANEPWAATVPNTGTPGQNIPGGLYGGFAQNSESGFIMPADTATVSGISYTAGLSDFGTRLKAVFTGIPPGVILYVSTTNASSYAVPGGTGTTPYAVLVAASQTNEALNDGAALTPLSGTAQGSDGLPAYPLTPDLNGTTAAIWEVVNSGPVTIDTLTFSVYIAYSGQPATTGQVGEPPSNVALGFAPEPGGGSFSVPWGITSPEPRFGILLPPQGSWVTINACTLSANTAPVPFAYSIGGTAPPSQTLPVTMSPGSLAVTVTPSVTTPANGTWLSASLSGGTLTISANPTGLSASATPYAGTVQLSAEGVTTVSVPVTLTVYPALTLSPSTSTLPPAMVNVPYSATVSPAGGSGSYTLSAPVLPGWMSFNSTTGALTGTPTNTNGSPVTVKVTVTDTNSSTTSQTYSLTVEAALAVSPSALPPAMVNAPYSTTVSATGGSGSYTLSAPTLPGWMSFNPTTGALTGIPTSTSGSPVTVKLAVTDSNQATASQTYSLTVEAALAISPSTLPPAMVGSPYSTTVSATGGSGSYTLSAQALPGWMTFNATTGALTGTPVTTNGSPVTVKVAVTDSNQAPQARLTA
jgi:hypothetical protein